MSGRRIVETTSSWFDLLAAANGLEPDVDGTRKYVEFNGLTFVAPLEQVTR